MFSQSILYIGLSQSLFAAFVLITKRRVEISDKILIACLLTFGLKFLVLLLYLEHAEFFDLQFSMGMVPLTFGPYLYLYTKYLVERKTRFDVRDLLHTAPLFLLTTAYFAFFKDEVTVVINASKARLESALVSCAKLAIESMSSDLFIRLPFSIS